MHSGRSADSVKGMVERMNKTSEVEPVRVDTKDALAAVDRTVVVDNSFAHLTADKVPGIDLRNSVPHCYTKCNLRAGKERHAEEWKIDLVVMLE